MLLSLLSCAQVNEVALNDRIVFEGNKGAGRGRHIVLLAGDEEYRSEEGLTQLAKILAARHRFKCTVVFPLDPDGTINPDNTKNEPGVSALDSADLCVMQLRFRSWPDAQMKHFVDYYLAGKPIVALRTSTHAFSYEPGFQSSYSRFGWQSKDWSGGFGRHVLGETWVSHWGNHGIQGTRAYVESDHQKNPICKGVSDLFVTTDVYEADPPADCMILLRGEVVEGLTPGAPQAKTKKSTSKGLEQQMNEPMMPVAWTRTPQNEARCTNRILTCTMGAATDLLNEGFRRFLVNGCYWALGMEAHIPQKADVRIVGDYLPSNFGFGKFKRGQKPSDFLKR